MHCLLVFSYPFSKQLSFELMATAAEDKILTKREVTSSEEFDLLWLTGSVRFIFVNGRPV